MLTEAEIREDERTKIFATLEEEIKNRLKSLQDRKFYHQSKWRMTMSLVTAVADSIKTAKRV